MGTVYQDALAAHSAAVDSVYSEGFSYQPFASANEDVNARGTRDLDRPCVEIVGVFLDPFARAFSDQTRRQGLKPERPGHASTRPQIDFDVTQLPYAPKSGDRVRRAATGKLYHLAEIKFPSAGTRVQADLNEIN